MGNGQDGIYISGGSGNTVLTNEIGNGSGSVAVPNNGAGIHLFSTVGALVDTSLVSGNAGHGIWIEGGSGTVVVGNLVGTNLAGTAALANLGNGIVLDQTTVSTIGQAVAGKGNVISGNGGSGVVMTSPLPAVATGNTLRNNVIGANVTGSGPVPNGGWGILVAGASDNTIGGTAAVDGNLVAYNTSGGIVVLSGTGNSIRVNRLRSNGGLGIDLDADGALPADGVTANDALDADAGGNRLQNYPVLTSSTAAVFSGILQSAPDTSYTLDGYASAAADTSGFGEAESWIGSTPVRTDGTGHASFTLTFAPQAAGSFFTATVTAPTNDTSELSKALVLGGTAPSGDIFSDDFESGSTSLWSGHLP